MPRHPKRNATTRGSWPNAILENFYECASGDPDDHQVWCYTDSLTYAPGDRVRFHVNTSAQAFDLEILRDGAVTETVDMAHDIPGAFHPTAEDCSVAGCGWPVAHEMDIPDTWRSGGYRVRTRARSRTGETTQHDHWFALRPGPQSPRGDLLLVAATSTWIAYNDWGGSNHYEGITGPARDQCAPVVSVERPFSRGFFWLPPNAPRAALAVSVPIGAPPRYPHVEWAYANGFSKKFASAGWATYERNFVRWAESQGYRVDVATQHDLHFRPEVLRGYDCVVVVGHDEYWSWEMRDAVDTYVEAGGRVARFGANFMWQVRLEDEGRRQVCYKYRARAEDPIRNGGDITRLTTGWEAPEVGRPGVQTFGLNALRGIYARFGLCTPRASGGFTVYRPEHWVFQGADLYYGDVFGAEARIFGYEVDGLDYIVQGGLPYPTRLDGAPDGIEILAMGLATLVEENRGHEGAPYFIADGDARFTAELLHGEATPETIDRVRRGSGMVVVMPKGKGEVFNAGSCEWVAGLIAREPFVERITCNVLDRYAGGRSAAPASGRSTRAAVNP